MPSYADVEQAGRDAVAPADVLPGVAALVPEVRLEVLMDDGARLVVLVEPLGPADADAPGSIRQAPAVDTAGPTATGDADRRSIEVDEHVAARRPGVLPLPVRARQSRLDFDRGAATGFRLDLPAGSTERWAPARPGP